MSESLRLCSLAARVEEILCYMMYNQGHQVKAQSSFSGGAKTREFLSGSFRQIISIIQKVTFLKNSLLVSFGKSFIGPNITIEWGRGSVQSPRDMVQADRHHSF